jgi:hypothetical protein
MQHSSECMPSHKLIGFCSIPVAARGLHVSFDDNGHRPERGDNGA